MSSLAAVVLAASLAQFQTQPGFGGRGSPAPVGPTVTGPETGTATGNGSDAAGATTAPAPGAAGTTGTGTSGTTGTGATDAGTGTTDGGTGTTDTTGEPVVGPGGATGVGSPPEAIGRPTTPRGSTTDPATAPGTGAATVSPPPQPPTTSPPAVPVGQSTGNDAGTLPGRTGDVGTGLPGQPSGPSGAVSPGLPGAPANALTPGVLPGSPGLPGGVGSTPNTSTPGSAVPVPGTVAFPVSTGTGADTLTGDPILLSPTPPAVVTPPRVTPEVTDQSCGQLRDCFAQLDRDLCLFDDPSCANAFLVPESVDEPAECASLLGNAPSYAVVFAAGRSEYDIPEDCR